MRDLSSVIRRSSPCKNDNRDVTFCACAWSSHKLGADAAVSNSPISASVDSMSKTFSTLASVATTVEIRSSVSREATRGKTTAQPPSVTGIVRSARGRREIALWKTREGRTSGYYASRVGAINRSQAASTNSGCSIWAICPLSGSTTTWAFEKCFVARYAVRESISRSWRP